MTEPLVVRFEVTAAPDRAFAVWTGRMSLWWPASHTVSGGPSAIVVEPGAGGRVVEVAPDGTEHPWGVVTAWEPPRRLQVRWHHVFAPEEATDLEVAFDPAPAGTAVTITQTGWERLGEPGRVRRERTVAGWAAVTTGYAAVVATTADDATPDP